MTTAETPADLLSNALAGTAPSTAAAVCAAVPPEVVAALVHAIDRRVYIAIRNHDEKVAYAIEQYMNHAREFMRLKVVGQTTDLGWMETAPPIVHGGPLR